MRLGLVVALLAALTWSTPEPARAADLPSGLQLAPEPSPLACLQPPREQGEPIAYPPERLKLKQPGTVRVRLRFTAPDRPPETEVFYSTHEDFTAAVQERVKSYRLPCLAAGAAAVVATQEFQFVPDDARRVYWGQARDEPRTPVPDVCFTTGGARPNFPRQALQRGEQGSVIAQMTFTSATEPPKVDILFDAGSRLLADAVRDFAASYRLACLPAGRSVVGLQTFQFVVDGETRLSLKDSTLQQVLAGVAGIAQQRVRFDLGTMACPFDLKLMLLQPYAPNMVGEVGRSDPNRTEFIEWLKTLALDLPTRMRKHVIGDTITISVPCGLIDLH